jgi:hypothetical protein
MTKGMKDAIIPAVLYNLLDDLYWKRRSFDLLKVGCIPYLDEAAHVVHKTPTTFLSR